MKYTLLIMSLILVSCAPRVMRETQTGTLGSITGSIQTGSTETGENTSYSDDGSSSSIVGTLPIASGSVTVSTLSGEAGEISPISSGDAEKIRDDVFAQ